MTTPLNIADRRELFVDYELIERLDNTRLRLHEPVSGGVIMRIDKPWEGAANFGLSVFEDRGKLHLYYRGWSDLDGVKTCVGCVAVSDDGVTWTRPELGLYHRPGWEGNNIIIPENEPGELSFPFAPFVDTRPGVPDNERIKGVTSEAMSGEIHTAMYDPAGPKRLALWTSNDGVRFNRDASRSNFITDLRNAFDGGNTLFWSEAEQQYVLYFRWADVVDNKWFRTIARATSKDLTEWTEPVPMEYGDTPREQFYTNNTQPYFRAPHIYIAMPGRFMEGRRALTDEQAAGLEIRMEHAYNDCSDAVLLTSRAGTTRYDRTFMESFVHPGPGPGNWVTRSNYPVTGLLPSGPNQMMFFVTRQYLLDSWHIERLLLRTDGFASVSAPWAGGEMATKPFTFTGTKLEINYRTGAPGFVQVEIQAADGTPLPGFSLNDCPEIIGDEIARVVRWEQGSDVGRLAGQAVRLRFVMKDADLYSLRFG